MLLDRSFSRFKVYQRELLAALFIFRYHLDQSSQKDHWTSYQASFNSFVIRSMIYLKKKKAWVCVSMMVILFTVTVFLCLFQRRWPTSHCLALRCLGSCGRSCMKTKSSINQTFMFSSSWVHRWEHSRELWSMVTELWNEATECYATEVRVFSFDSL